MPLLHTHGQDESVPVYDASAGALVHVTMVMQPATLVSVSGEEQVFVPRTLCEALRQECPRACYMEGLSES